MSDAVNGSADAGAAAAADAGAGADADAGNRTNINGAAADGSTADATTWLAGLSEENRATVEAKKWGKADDVLTAYRNLETHASKALTVPKADATPEEKQRFWEKLGRPADPGKYELAFKREGVPEGFTYDETQAINFRNIAHTANLTAEQAALVHDGYVANMVEGFKAQQQKATEAMETAHREIVREWGEPDSETYKTNSRLAATALRELGLADVMSQAGLVGKDGTVMNATGAKALARIGRELFAETTSGLQGAGGALKNPFESGENENMTEQGKLYRQDPDKARALIRAANRERDFPEIMGG